MQILEPIQARRSYRAYDASRPIAPALLESLVEAAHLAPSYGNSQGCRWILVDREPTLSALKDTLTEGNYWARKAPALAALVTGSDYTPVMADGRDYASFGAGLSAMNFMLQAESLDLVAHPMAGFNPQAAKQLLGIPERLTLILLFSLGFRGNPHELKEHHWKSETGPRVRQPLNSVFSWNCWEPQLEPKTP